MNTDTINASAQAHKLRGTIAQLDGEIRDAERVIVNADGAGKKLALDVLLGKATQADQERHRRDILMARDALSDKRAVRDAAREELRRLEAAENQEKRALAEAEARKLVEQRIEAARKFDQAARQMQEAFADFERLGDAIPGTGAQLRISPSNMAQWESIAGIHRIDGALPPLFRTIHRNLIRAASIPSLEQSEAALWRALLGE